MTRQRNSKAKKGGHSHVYCGAVVAVVVTAGLILFQSASINSTWNLTPLMFDAVWSPIAYPEHENYWSIPGDGALLLPLTNSSIDVYIDLQKSREQVKQQNKQCQELKEDPSTMFKSQPSNSTKFTADMDIKRIELAFMCGGVLDPAFLTAPPREELYPFEQFYLSEPPLWDESTVACHNHSTISLFGTNKSFIVGDPVTIAIKMFDTKGRPRLKGGDRLKVWLKDVKFNHSISANITDFDNGTYLATTVLPWAGSVSVKVTLRQPREFFRALAYVHRTLKCTMPFAGAYKNSKASEGVPCGPYPIIPGYRQSELCNLTLENGFPWYCGRPNNRDLNCSDYHLTGFSKIQIPMPITAAEDKLLKQKTFQNYFLPGEIIINIEATKSGLTRLPDPNVPCNKVSPRSTWHQSEPTGYFYHKVWTPFLCFVHDKVEQADESCLKNVHIICYGDSNSRYIYYRIKSKVRCKERLLVSGNNDYHAPKTCENKTSNFSVQYIPHSNPFHIGWRHFHTISYLYSPEKIIGSVPSDGRYIICLSHYLHYTAHHISVYERALVALREAIIRLLKRNPHVLILLRGPHVAEREPYIYYMGDVWGQYFATIQKETFRDLQDRVIYFPTWDITVASEDTFIHPACNDHLSDVIFQFLCGREQ